MQSRDEYFDGDSNYKKEGFEQKGNYRKCAVIDMNNKGNLAIVKLSTKGYYTLPNYKDGKSRYTPNIRTLDDEQSPIVLGSKFIPTNVNNDLSNNDVKTIKRNCLYGNHQFKDSNWQKLKALKKDG